MKTIALKKAAAEKAVASEEAKNYFKFRTYGGGEDGAGAIMGVQHHQLYKLAMMYMESALKGRLKLHDEDKNAENGVPLPSFPQVFLEVEEFARNHPKIVGFMRLSDDIRTVYSIQPPTQFTLIQITHFRRFQESSGSRRVAGRHEGRGVYLYRY